jgi:hypothetical protein
MKLIKSHDITIQKKEQSQKYYSEKDFLIFHEKFDLFHEMRL